LKPCNYVGFEDFLFFNCRTLTMNLCNMHIDKMRVTIYAFLKACQISFIFSICNISKVLTITGRNMWYNIEIFPEKLCFHKNKYRKEV